MASVKKFPGSKNWFACFKVPTGELGPHVSFVSKRVQRSAGTSDRSLALQLAISYERAAVLASERRWTEQSAIRFLKEIDILSGTSVPQVQPTEPFARAWLDARKRVAAPKSWQNMQGVIEDFLLWLGNRRSGPLMDISSRQIAEFRDQHLAAGKAPSTVNKELSFLCQLFEEAIAQGAMEKNPVRGLRVKGARKKAQKRRAFSFEQFRALVRCTAADAPEGIGQTIDRDWPTFLMILGYTGGRQQEVAKLTWDNVDLKGKRIGLVRGKSGGDLHWEPLHAALHAHIEQRLAKCADKIQTGFVMPGIAQMTEQDLSKTFREVILPRIGIIQPYQKPSAEKGLGRKLAEYGIHSFRHSFTSWLAAAGVSESMRMIIVGHEDAAVHRIYTHTEFEDARRDLAKIPSI